MSTHFFSVSCAHAYIDWHIGIPCGRSCFRLGPTVGGFFSNWILQWALAFRSSSAAGGLVSDQVPLQVPPRDTSEVGIELSFSATTYGHKGVSMVWHPKRGSTNTLQKRETVKESNGMTFSPLQKVQNSLLEYKRCE